MHGVSDVYSQLLTLSPVASESRKRFSGRCSQAAAVAERGGLLTAPLQCLLISVVNYKTQRTLNFNVNI